MSDERTPGTAYMVSLPDPLDVVALERRARELRAKVFADALRAAYAYAMRRIASARPAPQGRVADQTA